MSNPFDRKPQGHYERSRALLKRLLPQPAPRTLPKEFQAQEDLRMVADSGVCFGIFGEVLREIAASASVSVALTLELESFLSHVCEIRSD